MPIQGGIGEVHAVLRFGGFEGASGGEAERLRLDDAGGGEGGSAAGGGSEGGRAPTFGTEPK